MQVAYSSHHKPLPSSYTINSVLPGTPATSASTSPTHRHRAKLKAEGFLIWREDFSLTCVFHRPYTGKVLGYFSAYPYLKSDTINRGTVCTRRSIQLSRLVLNAERQESMGKQKKVTAICLLCAVICSPTVTSLEALVTSCVVIPCSFTIPAEHVSSSSLRGIWYRFKKPKEVVYDEDKTRVAENFRGRTRMLGQLSQKNCTLEIIEIKEHDSGRYCFIVLPEGETDASRSDKPSTSDYCVSLVTLSDPKKPLMTTPVEAIEGHPYTLTCSVTHTCPSNVPKLTWSRGQANEVTQGPGECHLGSCKVQSILTLIPQEGDDHSNINCMAKFSGGKTSSMTHKLYVKRKRNYNYIIIPTVVAIGTAAIFGVLCFFMVKKYKRRIAELQGQRGSVWNRLSRLSQRIRSNAAGSFRRNQRRGDVHSTSGIDQKIFKPRFPSPKSQRSAKNYQEESDDGDDYVNTEDLNVYGNL